MKRVLLIVALALMMSCNADDDRPTEAEQCTKDIFEMRMDIEELQRDYESGRITFQEFVTRFNELEAEFEELKKRCG